VVNSSGIVTQLIGTGVAGYSGDNGPASSAQLNTPVGVAVDSSGNIYIADYGNHRIRKVSGGTITTVAGNGAAGYNGDGIAATSAALYGPRGVAVDSSGNIYIADYYNQRIRKVSGGTISTVAGNGTGGYNGDGILATNAELNYPYGVAVDSSGNIYIADYYNQRIREVSGGTITTVAGNGTPGYNGDGIAATSAELNYPIGVAVDSSGNLYIADSNSRIREISSGTITTVVGTGVVGYNGDGIAATSAKLYYPSGVAVDSIGSKVYIADIDNYRIREVSAGIISTVAGNGLSNYYGNGIAATLAALSAPASAAADSSGNVYIADGNNCLVRKVTAGIITTVAGTGVCGYNGDGIAATSAQLNYPYGVAVDSSGNIYIADTSNQRIREVSGGTITTVAGTGSAGYNGDGIPATSAWLNSPFGVNVDSGGNIYIADYGNSRIRRVSGGTITTIAGNGSGGYNGDGVSATSAELYYPFGVVVDSSGNIYIADYGNQRIRRVSGGTITTVAGNGTAGYNGDGIAATSAQLYNPLGVAVDSSGNLYIADSGNMRIREVSGGTITTVAGNGTLGYSGDGGNPTLAELANPRGVAVDSSGNIFIADWGNNRIRNVNAVQAQTIIFGTLTNQIFGAVPFTVSATASSGLTVGFNSQTTSACTVSGATVTLLAVGTCTVQATQAGNTTYAAAIPVNQSFQVTQASQTITFGTLSNQVLGTAPFAVSATASSGLAVGFASTTSTVCTVSGATVTLVAVGTCTVQATQAGNSSYSAATAVNQSFQVTQAGQTITFGALANQVLGSTPFAVSASASSGLAVSFTSTTPWPFARSRVTS
jgi:sugar lactone lactonase YvrE